jgi:hypothetical protein
MVEKWTGALIGKMHNNGIKQVELAEKLGITNAYQLLQRYASAKHD